MTDTIDTDHGAPLHKSCSNENFIPMSIRRWLF